jgi:hypothetical protein
VRRRGGAGDGGAARSYRRVLVLWVLVLVGLYIFQEYFS